MDCIGGQAYLLGNHRLIEELGICTPEVESWLEDRERQGRTVVIIGSTEQVPGVIDIADSVRPEARSAMAALKQLGIENIITMLTDDNRGTAQAIAEPLLTLDSLAAVLNTTCGRQKLRSY